MPNPEGDVASSRTRALVAPVLFTLLATSACTAGRAAAPDGWARTALASAVPVEAPFQEVVFFSASAPWAAAYRVRLQRGEPLRARVLSAHGSPEGVHLELFEMRGPIAHRIKQARDHDARLDMTAQRTGEFIVRVRPESGQSGAYRVVLEGALARGPRAAFAFPVAGQNARAIRSRFGASRDGGARRHEGVDIFAPRGTPVVAAVSGTVSDVAHTPRGGKVVWVDSDEQGVSLYYAHLHEQHVRTGMRVRAGDTLGLVGNTGNARNTPAHLHFGVYQRGARAIDPEPFLGSFRFASATAQLPEVSVNLAGLGSWIMTPPAPTLLHEAPVDGARTLALLSPMTRALLVGGTSRWYRVALPDGTSGFIAMHRTDPAGL